jgi:hypothetical protein
MKLISMTDFVLDKSKNAPIDDYHEVNEKFVNSIISYAHFLKQPLTLGMFVACDEYGDILEEPLDEKLCEYCPIENWKHDSKGYSCEGSRCNIAHDNYLDKFKEAEERVLFYGFTAKKQVTYYMVYLGESPVWASWNESKTVENTLLKFEVSLKTDIF